MRPIKMLSSTYVALKSQGLPTGTLAGALDRAFEGGGLLFCPSSVSASATFWHEFVLSREAFRVKTGVNIEDVLAH